MSPSRPLNLHLPNSLDHPTGHAAGAGHAGLAAVLLRSHHEYLAGSLSGTPHPLDDAVGNGWHDADHGDWAMIGAVGKALGLARGLRMLLLLLVNQDVSTTISSTLNELGGNCTSVVKIVEKA